jgi:hypothetical protein
MPHLRYSLNPFVVSRPQAVSNHPAQYAAGIPRYTALCAALMELLANPLSQQAGKWLVIGTNG